MTTAGFVLVGGRSLRMGRDKALLPWRSGVLVQELAAKVAAVCGSVSLVGNPQPYTHLGLNAIPDFRPGLGPLAGLETALLSGCADYNLLLACDMPGVRVDHLCALLRHAQQTDAKCVISRDEAGRSHPLCAVYRSVCLPFVRNALDERRLKLFDLVSELGFEAVSTNSPIRNINTAADWEALRTAHGL